MNSNYLLMRYKKEGGFLLVAALGFIIVFSFLIFVVTQNFTAASNTQLFSMLSIQSANAANSGVGEGVYQLLNNAQSEYQCKTMSLQRKLNSAGLKNCVINIHCSVAVDEDEAFYNTRDNIYLVTSQARCGSGSIYASQTIDVGLLLLENDSSEQQYRIIYRKVK